MMLASLHSLLWPWLLLLLAVGCFCTIDVVLSAAADDTTTAAASSESAHQQSSSLHRQQQNKLRHLQFLPGDLCRCEASWEDFYPEYSSAQQQQEEEPQRAKYPGLFDDGHRGLQHYNYGTQEESENGLVLVEGIFILPPIDPFCISLGARNRRHSRDLLDGIAVNVPPETESETVTTTSTSASYNRGNGRLEILIGAARPDGGGTSSTTTTITSVHQQENNDDEPKAADDAGEEEPRDLVNCHGAHLEQAAGYGRLNPYNNRRPSNYNVYGVQNQRPGRYWANRPYTTTATSSNNNAAGIYGTKIMGIGKGKCNEHYAPVAAPYAGASPAPVPSGLLPPPTNGGETADCTDLGPSDIANCCFSACDGSEGGGIEQPSGTVCASCACNCPPIPQVYNCLLRDEELPGEDILSATNTNNNDNALAQSPPQSNAAAAPPILTSPDASAATAPQQQTEDLSSWLSPPPPLDDDFNTVADPCRVEVNIECAEAEDGISLACTNYFVPIDSLICQCNEECAKSYNFVYTGLDCSSSIGSGSGFMTAQVTNFSSNVISCQDHASFVKPSEVKVAAFGGGRLLLNSRASAGRVLTLENADIRCIPNEVKIRVTDIDDPDIVYQEVTVNTACDASGLKLNDRAGALEFAGYNCLGGNGAGSNCLQDVAVYVCGENTGPRPFQLNTFKVNVDGDENDLFDASTSSSSTSSTMLEPLATYCIQDQVRTVNMCNPGYHYLRAYALGTCDGGE